MRERRENCCTVFRSAHPRLDSMWPRGEVGAGILVISLSYGIGGPVFTVAMLSLALNLALTGLFILIVKAPHAGRSDTHRRHGRPAGVLMLGWLLGVRELYDREGPVKGNASLIANGI